jgi:hypothetical protein
MDRNETLRWITEAAAQVAAQQRLDGEVWADCYSDFGFGRLMSFGMKGGKVTEVHVEDERFARADPIFPLRLVLTAGQQTQAAWIREGRWDLAA